MGLTTGTILFYGGIIGMAVSLLTALILQGVFKKQRKKLLDNLHKEY